MAQDTGFSDRRIVVLSPRALDDQFDINVYTAEKWGDQQADFYSEFLSGIAQMLADKPSLAPIVLNRSQTRCYVARWKNARYGHRIFFEEIAGGINIVRILHTAANWRKQLGNK